MRSAHVVASILATILLMTAPSEAQERPPGLGIAPLEADLESMREVLRQIEEAVNDGAPERAEALISPSANDPQRQSILASIRHLSDQMTPGARYHLRTDLGRGALVPVGPEKVQIQVRGVRVVGEERYRASVQLQLEAVEEQGRRRWLLTGLNLPGQRAAPPVVGQRWLPAVAVTAAVVVGLALVIVVLIRRRRRR